MTDDHDSRIEYHTVSHDTHLALGSNISLAPLLLEGAVTTPDSNAVKSVVGNINNSSELNPNVFSEITNILKTEGWPTLFLGLGQRLLYTGLANGIRLAAYGTSRMDLIMKSFDALG
jgi:hypothetical protein